MRSISELAGIIILLVYWMITLLSWWAINGCFRQMGTRAKITSTCLYFFYSLILSILFFILYFIHPEQSGTHYYSFYSFFNALFVADLICKTPFTMAALAFIFLPSLRTRMVLIRMGFILSTALSLVFLYGFLQGAKSFEKQEVTLTFRNLPKAFDGFRIVQLSDSHLGSANMKKLLKNMSAVSEGFKPDMVVFTGDLVNNFASESNDYPASLLQFKSTYGNYAVPGNHDYGDYTRWQDSTQKARNLSGIKKDFRESGFRLLCNESEKIILGDDSIYMVGVENPGHPPFPQYADLTKATKGLPDSAFCVLLCHDPAFWDAAIKRDNRFPITLAGHSHGLQWGFRLAGIGFSMMKPILKRWGGLYEYDHRYIYVNRGIGMIGMHFRIDMPAEITLLTLQRGEIDR
jgi:predicted MPP superfamily phosphohydrolase